MFSREIRRFLDLRLAIFLSSRRDESGMTHDVRYAIRSLRRTPGFTAAAVLTLALAIGATTVIFAVVNGVLLQPLRYPDPDRLIAIAQRHVRSGPEFATWPDYLDWRESSSLQHIGGAWGVTFNLTGIEEPERLRGALVTASLFPTLGTSPIVGRAFADADEDKQTVVLSHSLWQRQFAGDRAVLGRRVVLNGRPHTIVGVMPAGFAFPETITELWTPLVPEAGMNRGYHLLNVIGRLAPGAIIDHARAELTAIAIRSADAFPETNKDWGVEVKDMREANTDAVSRALWILAAAVCCLLLIACANVASLLLSRVAARREEMSVRSALGASRARLIRQLLVESSVLAVCGGIAGWMLASLSIEPLIAITPLPRASEISVNATVLVFTFVVCGVAVVLFGLAPALAGSRSNLQRSITIRGGSRSGGGRPSLLSFQVAAAVVLLAGAGLLMHSFYRLLHVDTGFNGDRVMTVRFFLPRATYPVERCIQLYEQMIDRAREIPGVETAAATSVFPFSGVNANVLFEIEGRTLGRPGERPGADLVTATPGYFQTLRIPLLRGRDFERADRPASQFVAVINRATADRFFPDQDPIGQFVRILGPKPRMIVGIVGNTRQRELHSEPQPEIYIPHTQFPAGQMFLVVRTRQDEALIASRLRTELRALDSELPIATIRTAEDVLDDTLLARRFSLILLSLFACAALGLATLGVFGVVAFGVAQQTREIGIRIALGATTSSVLRQTLWRGMFPVIVGMLLGLAAARALTGMMTSMLFEVRPADPITIAGVAVTLIGAALAAAWIPARRASKVDPMVALRHE
jgi:putative ABC transport system permease protein